MVSVKLYSISVCLLYTFIALTPFHTADAQSGTSERSSFAIDWAAENKNVNDSFLQSALRSPKTPIRIRGIRALGRILTPLAESKLLEVAADPASNDEKVIFEIYFALGQLAWNKAFTLESGAATSLFLRKRFDASLSNSQTPTNPEKLKTLSELAVANMAWRWADPHVAVVEMFNRLRASDYAENESIKVGLIKGWIQTQFVRSGWISDAPDLPVPPETSAFIERELRVAETDEYRILLLFAASHWKVQIDLNLSLQLIEDRQDRNVRLFALQQFIKFPRSRAKESLKIGLKSKDPSIRITSFQGLNSSEDANANELSTAIRAELEPAPRAQMLEFFLASSKSLKTPEEASQWVKVLQPSGRYGWARSKAYHAWLERIQNDEELKKSVIVQALRDPVLQVRLMGADHLKSVSDFSFRLKWARLLLPNAHAALASRLLKTLFNASSTDETTLNLVHAYLLRSQPLIVREAALESMWAYVTHPKFGSLMSNALDASKDFRYLDLRQKIVAGILKQKNLPLEIGNTLLEKIWKSDPLPAVSNAARKALIERGISGLPDARAELYVGSPYRQIQLNTDKPCIEFNTKHGRMVVQLDVDAAPMEVRTFIGLLRANYFNNIEFYRVITDYLVQSGSKNGTNARDVPFLQRGEMSPMPFVRGSLGMARRAGFDTGSSHFFFTTLTIPEIDRSYTWIGQVTEGMDVLDRIEPQDLIHSVRELSHCR